MNQKIFQELDHKHQRQKSIPYEQLAFIYNRVMRHVNYSHWARFIAAVMQKQSAPGVKILDIGCGTGEFVYEIGNLGFPADGCDPSPSMLKIAQSKNPHRKFWMDKLPELIHTQSRDYSTITCLYDTMNYLPSLSELVQAVQRVYELLPVEGLFIFDVVSEKFCRDYFHEVDEKEVLDTQYAYLRESYYIKAKAEQINQFTIYTPHGIYEEKHIQKIFPYSQIERVIRQNSRFEILALYEDFTFFTADDNSNRAHFILKKVVAS